MAGLNQCNFIGNLGRDPEMRYTSSEKAVANFSIAVTEKYKDNEYTEWVRCVAWERLAEICGEYLKKGSTVFISGKLKTRQWEDKDGNKRYTTEVVANSMQMLGGRNDTKERQTNVDNVPEDEIPF